MTLRLLPGSLFGRLLLALVGVVGLTLLIIVLLIVRERRDLALLGTGAWSTAEVIADTTASLAQLAPEARTAAIERFRQEAISTEDPPRPRRRPDLPRTDTAAIARTYASRIQKELGGGYTVEVSRARVRDDAVIRVGPEPRRMPRPAGLSGDGDRAFPGGRDGSANSAAGAGERRLAGFLGARFLDVNVTLPDGQQLVFRTVAPQPGPPLPRQIFLELALVTLALALVLFFMTRNITRPLSDLAQAAEAVGRGGRTAPLAERGARELRNATRAFNAMQERLQRYLDSRTRVLAAMSHDLRTPLTRLRLRAESIDNPALKARFTADLEEMSDMVQGALSLFRDLNDDEALEAVDVDALLARLRSEFGETSGEVVLSGAAGAPLVARPRALKRCIANLLQNAIKYGSRAHVITSDGAAVTIRIRDEGPGIQPELLEQVFEPFFRAETSRNRDTGGVGLGLCIARDIAQAHGGQVSLANLAGGGLEATLVLPRADRTQRPGVS